MLKIDDGSVLPHWPHVCTLCASQPTKGEFAIDTEIDYVDPQTPHLGSRKYVCQKCAEALVELVPDKTKDKLKAEVAKWKSRYGALAAALDTLTTDILHVND